MSAGTIEIQDNTFDNEVVNSETPVVAYFWATWCQSCKLQTVQMEKLAAENEGVYKVIKVNIAENPELAQQYEVMSTPTVLLFKPGQSAPAEIQAGGFYAKDWLADMIAVYLNK